MAAVFFVGVGVLLLTWSRAALLGLAVAGLGYLYLQRPRAAGWQITGFVTGLAAFLSPLLGGGELWDATGGLTAALLVALAMLLVWQWGERDWRTPLAWASLAVPSALLGLATLRIAAGEFLWNILLRPSSTQGHWERGYDGIIAIVRAPWGLGLGDAGPASARFAKVGETGFLPESWYLQVGLESGAIGLILFVAILWTVGGQLRRAGGLGQALLLALLGLATASVFLHTWESAAVALGFWGLAGVTLQTGKKNGTTNLS